MIAARRALGSFGVIASFEFVGAEKKDPLIANPKSEKVDDQ
jgi:hypothetical protein